MMWIFLRFRLSGNFDFPQKYRDVENEFIAGRMNPNMTETSTKTSAWAPFRIPVFRALWIATLASNIGTWMHDIGAGWLMTSLSPSPMMVALVQTATTLPVFLLALPAGALADIVDRRRYLIITQVFMAIAATCLAVIALTGVMTPWLLVALTFAMGLGTAMMMPAWAAITPELVPRAELPSAIALNSMGINVARAIGPAIAGVIVSMAGSGAVFALNALSFIGVISVLTYWKRTPHFSELPAERVLGAMRAGLRFTRHSAELQAAVMRGLGFFLFASASWALLPLVARQIPDGGPQAFGILVASVGVGAVLGALVLPALREKISRDGLVAGATLVYALCLWALANLSGLWLLAPVMALSGTAWITVLSSLQVAAQLALPGWVRSRGLAVFMSTFMGSMAMGSLCWGTLADLYGIGFSLTAAASGAVVALLLTWRWKVGGAETLDLTPAMHWPSPPVIGQHDRGPVLVTIEYQVQPEKVTEFLSLIYQLGKQRRRDGAFAWGVFEDTERTHHFIETFNDESWLAHLRQHERVTIESRNLQQRIKTCLSNSEPIVVRHYLSPE
jgi:MFS family permease